MPIPASEKSRIVGCLWFVIILLILLVIAVGPISSSHDHSAPEALMRAQEIGLAMGAYANAHNGVYPDGKTSTEVFQKLLDGHYIDDPSVFYLPSAPGKSKATTGKLMADNVCFDVTSGVTKDAPQLLPVVFSTGFIVTYLSGAEATPEPNARRPFHGAGIAVNFFDGATEFLTAAPDGSIHAFVPSTFSPRTKTYGQLRP